MGVFISDLDLLYLFLQLDNHSWSNQDISGIYQWSWLIIQSYLQPYLFLYLDNHSWSIQAILDIY